MPLFNFHCPGCNAEFEALAGFADTPACPNCGSTAVQKLLSRVAPDAKTPGLVKRARATAARAGHFSNYSPSERPRG